MRNVPPARTTRPRSAGARRRTPRATPAIRLRVRRAACTPTPVAISVGVAGGLAGAFYGVGSSVSPLLGWRQFLLILMVALVVGSWGLGGVILVGVGTSVALAAMALQFDQVLYAQVVLIVAFVVVLKVRGTRRTETAKV